MKMIRQLLLFGVSAIVVQGVHGANIAARRAAAYTEEAIAAIKADLKKRVDISQADKAQLLRKDQLLQEANDAMIANQEAHTQKTARAIQDELEAAARLKIARDSLENAQPADKVREGLRKTASPLPLQEAVSESVNDMSGRVGVNLNDIINAEKEYTRRLGKQDILGANALIQDGQYTKKALQESILEDAAKQKLILENAANDSRTTYTPIEIDGASQQRITQARDGVKEEIEKYNDFISRQRKEAVGGIDSAGYVGDEISNTVVGAGLLGGAVVGTALANVANRNAQLNQERLAGESADEIVNGILNYQNEEAVLRKELMDQKAAEEAAKMKQIYGDTLDGFSELADLAYEAQNELKELQNNKNASVKEVREQREYANALLNELAAREAIIAERLTHNGLDTGLNTQKQKAEFLKDFMKVNKAGIQDRMGYLGRGKDMITDSRIGLRNAYNATASKFADAVDYSVLNRLGNSIVNSSLYNSLANGLLNASDSARTRWNSLKDWYANRRLVNADLNVEQVK